MHKTLFPRGSVKTPLTSTFTPSKGPFQSWVWIRDRYYVRLLGGGLTALSPEYSNVLRQKLEHRNHTLKMVKVGITIGIGIVAGVLMVWGGLR